MMLSFTSLNSGSNGNCYYIGNEHDAVLVDAGISCRETVFRMTKLGLPISRVKAIFITHEHSDHIRGVEFLSRKYSIPVYVSAGILLRSLIQIEEPLLQTFAADETIEINSLQVSAFQKLHDSVDPYSFTVSGNGYTVGVFTDIGEPCANVIHHFSRCDAAFLEANYDEEMLHNGSYPLYLKKRIKSNVGHLSNAQSLDLFRNHRAKHLSHLVLSHLSEHNNHPGIVKKLFLPHANGTRIEIASRYRESEIFSLNNSRF